MGEVGRLPVVNFAAGGVATPADAALMMQLGMDGVFVGSGIFKSSEPIKRARAIVEAVANYTDAKGLVKTSTGLGAPMVGINCDDMKQRYADNEGGNMSNKRARVEGKPHGTFCPHGADCRAWRCGQHGIPLQRGRAVPD